ncbi:MAG: hypothetical protein ISS48_05015 [Candidatus Aenigmarchaeota archaeon]|nr:hypothetical protein [Candidatus Aenigmarchaeota archaeon]
MKKSKTPVYGILGFLLIIFSQLLLIIKGYGFSRYSFPLIWFGYILFVDGLAYRFRGNSLIKNNFKNFAGLFIISMFFWWAFMFIDTFIQNWNYITLYDFPKKEYFILSSITFSMVLPSILETADLLGSLTSFNFKTKKWEPTKRMLYLLIVLGAVLLIIPIVKPSLVFPLAWVSLFLIFDPINYLKKQPSILKNISRSDWAIPCSLLIAGIICGFFWEFWNYWSYPKWAKCVPFLDFFRTFDVSFFGYILYFFFSWELFSMYHFVKFVWKKYSPPAVNFIKKLIS